MNFNYRIIEICIAQAKSLLEEFNEFFPFAFALKKDSTIVPISTFWGDDFPTSQNMINELEKAFDINDEKNNYIGVAICSNVQYSYDGTQEKKVDALEIRVDFLAGPTINFYETYKLSDKNIFVITDELLEKGTLLFFNK